MQEAIDKIIQRWFLSEPALFRVMCLFTLKENSMISCPVRIGARDMSVGINMESQEIISQEKGLRRLEYNPELLRTMSEQERSEYFKCEMIRVLLKHPYERQPEGCSGEACSLGSDILLRENYDFHYAKLPWASQYGLKSDQIYEWYCMRIQEMGDEQIRQSGGAGADILDSSPLHDLSENWQEDQFMMERVNSVIRQCEESNQWGTLRGTLIEKIIAGAKARINWRTVLNGFRASILSSRRKLTRMRPSRRFDFDQMGSIREFDTKLLVAIDVSGSIERRDIEYFLGVINSGFRYGIQQLDVIQFDAGITTVMTVRQALKSFSAVGRGGTNFQPAIDYAVRNGYDGLVMLTDGFADKPVVPHRTTLKVTWVCTDEHSYDINHEWMEKTGRVCIMDKRS